MYVWMDLCDRVKTPTKLLVKTRNSVTAVGIWAVPSRNLRLKFKPEVRAQSSQHSLNTSGYRCRQTDYLGRTFPELVVLGGKPYVKSCNP